MSKNTKIWISFGIALLFGIPFKWIFYKSEVIGVNIFEIFDYGISNLFFAFSTLALNILIIFGILTLIEKTWNKTPVKSN